MKIKLTNPAIDENEEILIRVYRGGNLCYIPDHLAGLESHQPHADVPLRQLRVSSCQKQMRVKLTNPALDKKDSTRVVLGGGDSYNSVETRLSHRESDKPIQDWGDVGFRLVRNK